MDKSDHSMTLLRRFFRTASEHEANPVLPRRIMAEIQQLSQQQYQKGLVAFRLGSAATIFSLVLLIVTSSQNLLSSEDLYSSDDDSSPWDVAAFDEEDLLSGEAMYE